MLSDQTLEKLDRLALSMKAYARGGAGGVRRSRMLGSSAEFSDFREYAPGDDIRRIDWNAFARFDKLFLKLFMEEQEMTVSLILDASRSMLPKWDFCAQLAEALGYLALRGGDKVSLCVLSDACALVSQRFSGRASFLGLCAFLDSVQPSGEAALDQLVPELRLGARGMSIVISDLLFEGEGERALQSLAFRRQQLALIQVLSPMEMRPELTGALRLVDSESDKPMDLVMDRATLDGYQTALDAFVLRTRARAVKLGASSQTLCSDQPLMDAILRGLVQGGVVQ